MPHINNAKSISLERNILHNLDVPISRIPDEVLAMIFEEGRRPRKHGHRFGVVLSHVSHRWRNVATTTPKLWNYLRLQEQPHDDDDDDDESHDEGDVESPELLRELTRARAFLSRSRLCPVDIYIEGFEDVTPEFIQLIGEHVGHCRELRTREVGVDCLDQLLECFSSKPIPLLTSIDLSSKNVLELPEQLFPHGAPRLTTIQLDSINMLDIHLHLAAFSSVTCLKLTAVDVDDSEGHSSFRDGLMALPSLHHLELQLHWFDVMPHHLPIVLPTIQFLHIDAADCRECFGPLISILHAASLTTLSLTAWCTAALLVDFEDGLELHLPSLKHLILADGAIQAAKELYTFARTFPNIERLSAERMSDFRLSIVLDSCPTLQTFATSKLTRTEVTYNLHNVVRGSQEAGHPIRRLMLPKTWFSETNAEDVVELRKIIVMEEYYVDWPTPFEQEYFED
ncbi:hypothetical protein FIBSPDRAFT_1040538 [Athelia psychrophila]|uniref:Uncharacterized protein n=1 Tax=Athelia psychrophila TaxID=1759441 RepID=A0A166Q5T9_9AGAM|nr:hypothetical protein FIBSPDRAFT_1040538 [Fibularhizoctonia sp. CBS 109695]